MSLFLVVSELSTDVNKMRSFLAMHIKQWASGMDLSPFLITIIIIATILLLAYAINLLLRFLALPLIKKLGKAPKMHWILQMDNYKVFQALAQFLCLLLIISFLPIAFRKDQKVMHEIFRGVFDIWMIIAIIQLLDRIISYARSKMMHSETYRDHPLLGLFQVFKVIVYIIGVIYIFAIIFSVDVNDIFLKVGAMSAVLMLIFRDTILGFVAGIQLSANDMVRRGDWITMEKYGADGDVIDITLNTVKIRNFDQTITTIPPYAMISDSFQNWRGMQSSGGRRIKRSLYIDMQTVTFADKHLIEDMKKQPMLKAYLEKVIQEITQTNDEQELWEAISRRRLTNLGIFRHYVANYLKHHNGISKSFVCMVRQLQATDTGLPLEVYCFADTIVWLDYEEILSDIFEHLLAVLPLFGLQLFQNVNGNDMGKLCLTFANKTDALQIAPKADE